MLLFLRKPRQLPLGLSLAIDLADRRQHEDRKWRRKPLKSLETGSQMAIGWFGSRG
jgi:hypothetical protein